MVLIPMRPVPPVMKTRPDIIDLLFWYKVMFMRQVGGMGWSCCGTDLDPSTSDSTKSLYLACLPTFQIEVHRNISNLGKQSPCLLLLA
jgi:hypothetical protein